MKAEIISGDFPKRAVLSRSGLFANDLEIRWSEGWVSGSESLKGNIESVELLDMANLGECYPGNGLTPLEGGVIGGSIAGYDGFLAGYLSLPDYQETVIFICHLADGRHFIAVSDIEMYNLIAGI